MRHKKGEYVNGWLIIDKPVGMGSTTVVNQTRILLNAQKNGHTGTLDPFATGVLPIAFGEATKLISYVMDGDKEYEFVLNFGAETDTLDCTGKVIKEGGFMPSEEDIRAVLPFFTGEIEQVPPAFSAIKVDGKRAYDLVRKGENVEMKPRRVRIERIDLLEMLSDNRAKFRVVCSKGTYVRTLGADLAKKLGTWGFLSELRQTKCANFGVEHTILLENLKKMEYAQLRREELLPLLTSLCDITVIAVREEDAVKLRQGQGVSPKNYEVESLIGKEVAMVLDGDLVAMVRIDEKRISPVRVFNL